MRRKPAARPILPPDWTEVLGRVQQTLQEADAAAAQRVAALEPATPGGELAPRPIAGLPDLNQARGQFDQLASYLDRATRIVSDADMALAAGEDALQSWLQASQAARRKLADWVGRG